MPVVRTVFHVVDEAKKKEFKERFCKSILMGTNQQASVVSMLQNFPNVLEMIYDFSKPAPTQEDQYYYKMGMVMCTGTEHVHVEALQSHLNRTATVKYDEVKANGDFKVAVAMAKYGSLSNQPIGGASWFLTKDFLKEYAWRKNEHDDSWWNEGQLRAAWRDFCVPRFCQDPDGRCKGLCCALPGDTVYWGFDSIGYKVSTRYEPATQEDLVERGYVNYELGQKGILEQQATIGRDDPSQLESDSDEGDE